MRLLRTATLTPEQEVRIDGLWNEAYPVQLAHRFRRLLGDTTYPMHYLLLDDAGEIAAWAMTFRNDGETRFSIIVPEAVQGRGYGRQLLDNLKADLSAFYGWVIDHDRDLKANGKPYRTPLPFYLKAGLEALPDQRIDSELISAVKVRWCTVPELQSFNNFPETP